MFSQIKTTWFLQTSSYIIIIYRYYENLNKKCQNRLIYLEKDKAIRWLSNRIPLVIIIRPKFLIKWFVNIIKLFPDFESIFCAVGFKRGSWQEFLNNLQGVTRATGHTFRLDFDQKGGYIACAFIKSSSLDRFQVLIECTYVFLTQQDSIIHCLLLESVDQLPLLLVIQLARLLLFFRLVFGWLEFCFGWFFLIDLVLGFCYQAEYGMDYPVLTTLDTAGKFRITH